MDLLKFLDKYGKELSCPKSYDKYGNHFKGTGYT